MIARIVYLVIGLIAVYGLVLLARRHHPTSELRPYAAALVIAAGIYVAFGLVLGGKPLGFELVQLAAFTALAVAGLRYSPLLLAGAWLLHSAWDAVHVLPSLAVHVPEWYVFACLSFDIALATYILVNRHHLGLRAGEPAL